MAEVREEGRREEGEGHACGRDEFDKVPRPEEGRWVQRRVKEGERGPTGVESRVKLEMCPYMVITLAPGSNWSINQGPPCPGGRPPGVLF